jgi:hypothetical protein
MKVIKVTTTRDASIYLTPEQMGKLHNASVTLRSSVGDPYCQISQGVTESECSTYTDEQIDQLIARRA